MNTLEAIAARRSIRKFLDKPISRADLETILRAGIQAPSGKNKQPWRFIVVGQEKRAEMRRVMGQALEVLKKRGDDVGSAEWTQAVMAQAPVTLFVLHPDGTPPWEPHTVDQMFSDVVDLQSSGAAIQNMLLAALDLGIGSLWICDALYAYQEFLSWLGEKGELVAAVSFGYPGESPEARPRKSIEETVRFV